MVPVGLLGANDFRQTVIAGLNAIVTETCTPTHDAYVAALEAYGRSGVLGQKHILLMTDGTPTVRLGCQPGECTGENAAGSDQEIVAEIRRAREQGVKTFVLGSPGSELHMETGEDNRPWLSQAAEAGGTASDDCAHGGPNFCHFDMTQAADFAAALRDNDLSFGNFANGIDTPAGWLYEFDWNDPVPWWGRLWDEATFRDATRCRWQALRAGSLTTAAIDAKLDEFTALLAAAQVREDARWELIGREESRSAYVGATWMDDIAYLKSWLAQRFAWLDAGLAGACP